MQIDDIRRVLVVGAGTMGQQIGLQCAMYGYEVTLLDAEPGALDQAQARLRGYLDRFVAAGRMTAEQADAALGRVRATDDMASAAAEADLVSEAVPENPELKAQVFAALNRACPPRTIFTTNTSTLLPSMYAEATGRPAQFAALHFHKDVWISNVVDIMPHPGTAPEAVALLDAFARRIGQIPIHSHVEHSGYVFNTMLNALLGSALGLAANGLASVEDIDRAWMGVMKMPVGPFGMLDSIGLQTAWTINDYWATTTGDPQLRANADFLRRYLDDGRSGSAAGRGFYDYPSPAFARPEFLSGE